MRENIFTCRLIDFLAYLTLKELCTRKWYINPFWSANECTEMKLNIYLSEAWMCSEFSYQRPMSNKKGLTMYQQICCEWKCQPSKGCHSKIVRFSKITCFKEQIHPSWDHQQATPYPDSHTIIFISEKEFFIFIAVNPHKTQFLLSWPLLTFVKVSFRQAPQEKHTQS